LIRVTIFTGMNRRRHEGAAPAEAAKACRNDGLTGKQRLFVTEYLIDLNGTQAAIRAGYSRESARSIACENLTKPDIAEAIDRALAERPGITRTRIVDELAKIGFSDIRRVVSWRSETVTAEPSEGDEGEGTNAIVSRVTVRPWRRSPRARPGQCRSRCTTRGRHWSGWPGRWGCSRTGWT
jgi:hypothetical protein